MSDPRDQTHSEDDFPDVERVPYPEPEVGTTQNDDDQSGPPTDKS